MQFCSMIFNVVFRDNPNKKYKVSILSESRSEFPIGVNEEIIEDFFKSKGLIKDSHREIAFELAATAEALSVCVYTWKSVLGESLFKFFVGSRFLRYGNSTIDSVEINGNECQVEYIDGKYFAIGESDDIELSPREILQMFFDKTALPTL